MFSGQVIGVDLGTAHTVIYLHSRGIVLREHSVVAKNRATGAIEVVGDEAWKMMGRTPQNLVASHPLDHGVIADFSSALEMLAKFMQSVVRTRLPMARKPHVVISVPSSATPVERKAAEEVALEAGAKTAVTLEAGMAAAIGAGLPVAEARGNMVVDIGAGTTEIAVVSLGGIVHSMSLRVGGNDLDRAIVHHIKRHYNAMIGDNTAESLKVKIGRASIPTELDAVAVTGRDLVNGLPKSWEVTAAEVAEAMAPVVDQIMLGIKRTLEQVPAELAADIYDYGIVLTGGGALLQGMSDRIAAATSVPVAVCDEPMDAVAIGTGHMLEGIHRLQKRIQLPEIKGLSPRLLTARK